MTWTPADIKDEIMARWVAALRDPEAKQTTHGCLKDHKGRCCLGVLCDVFSDDHPDAEWEQLNDGRFAFKASREAKPEQNYLPPEVAEWAGFKLEDHDLYRTPEDPRMNVARSDQSRDHEGLARTNDNGASFETIANMIEDHLRTPALTSQQPRDSQQQEACNEDRQNHRSALTEDRFCLHSSVKHGASSAS